MAPFQFLSFVLLLLAKLRAHAQLVQDAGAQTISELEHHLFDESPNNFFSGVRPCTLYIDSTTALPNNVTGRQTSAQWIRVAFHDFVTAQVAAGVGGLDASIGFEIHRPENVGPAFNDSLFFFQFFFNDRTSMADLVALGVVVATGGCGGPNIPLRGGRIDATAPGPTGFCEPETDLKTTLREFSDAGFSQKDTISLTACGHTMGGVHRASFPNVVAVVLVLKFLYVKLTQMAKISANAINVEGTDGREDFDESVAVFDSQHVHDYLAGTGTAGGPLVTSRNNTVNSDLRLFSSDNNRTIKSLVTSKDSFANTCSGLMARMIDTVPKGVSLLPQVRPSGVKPIEVSLGIDWNGTMSLVGTVRYMDSAASAPARQNLDIVLKDRKGRATLPSFKAITNPTMDNGTGLFGPVRRYPFNIDFPATSGLSALVVKGKSFAMQDSIFVVTPLSSVNPGLAAFLDQFKVQPFTFNITVAVLLTKPQASVEATFAIPSPQAGTISPKIDRSTSTQIPFVGQIGPYSIFSVVQKLELNVVQVFGSSLDVEVPGLQQKISFFKFNTLLK